MPSKAFAINETKLKALEKEIKRGLSRTKACHLARVNEKTFYNYRNRGEEIEEQLYKLEILHDDCIREKKEYREIYRIREQIAKLEKDVYYSFLQRIRIAEAKDDKRLLKQINEASQGGDLKATQWKLEKKKGSEWAQKIEHTGKDGGAIKTEALIINVTDMDEEE